MNAHQALKSLIVRPEEPRDVEQVRQVNLLAFGAAMGSEVEAALVDALRDQGQVTVSLVAVLEDRVVGHILFSPMTCDAENALGSVISLAPMAVLPDLQRRGIGSRLVDAGLEACRSAGHDGVVVLGHPEYYPRFGFRPASTFGIRTHYDVPDEAFMAIELHPGGLSRISGTVRYQPAFDGI